MGFLSNALSSVGLGGVADFFATKHLQNDQQSFQKFMARNAHQMQVEDLRKAGLNPILSANLGGASGSGGGGANFGGFSSGISSAAQSRRVKHEVDVLDSQKEVNEEKAQTERDTQYMLRDQAAMYSKAAIKSLYETLLMEARLPYENAMRDFYATTEGRELAKWDKILGGATASNARTAAGLAWRGARNFSSARSAKELYDKVQKGAIGTFDKATGEIFRRFPR